MADLSRAVVNISDSLTQLKNQQAILQEDVRKLTTTISRFMRTNDGRYVIANQQ
ncbi:hypothetical protein ACOME3_009109 [Neoechinorhynchus agilis]